MTQTNEVKIGNETLKLADEFRFRLSAYPDEIQNAVVTGFDGISEVDGSARIIVTATDANGDKYPALISSNQIVSGTWQPRMN